MEPAVADLERVYEHESEPDQCRRQDRIVVGTLQKLEGVEKRVQKRSHVVRVRRDVVGHGRLVARIVAADEAGGPAETGGDESDRESVVQGMSGLGWVLLGGCLHNKKK